MYRRHPPGGTPLPLLHCLQRTKMRTHSYLLRPKPWQRLHGGAQRLHLPSHTTELGAKAHFRYVRGPNNRHCDVWVSRDGSSPRPDRGTSTGAAGHLAHVHAQPSKTQRHHFRACRRSTLGASIRPMGKRMCQNSFLRYHLDNTRSR